jgi:ABC-type antimicrobial peptide transport system permease subunit
MKISDILTMCFRNLSRSKSRTLLTVIGVVVGTCAIVVMISIGIGLQASTDAMLAQMPDLTVINVMNYGGVNSKTGEPLVLDDLAISGILAQPRVVAATPIYQPYDLNMQVVSGNRDRYQMWPSIMGVYPEAMEAFGYELIEGSFDFTNTKKNSVTALVGEYTDYNFRDTRKKGVYSGISPYPDEKGEIPAPYVNLSTETARLVLQSYDSSKPPLTYDIVVKGRLKEDWSKDYETSRGFYMDIAELKKLSEAYRKANKIKDSESTNTGYEQAKVKVSDIKYVEEVESYIQELGYQTYSMETTRKPLQQQARQQQVILGSLGAISLIVAAIGIANTMFMSILERTREIGIMKVVGCFVQDIRVAFLIEASAIGLMGGAVGVILSFGVSFLMNTFGFSIGGNPYGYYGEAAPTDVSIIPWWLVIGALIFSTLVGLISGYFPANRAVKIEALEAIKHE